VIIREFSKSSIMFWNCESRTVIESVVPVRNSTGWDGDWGNGRIFTLLNLGSISWQNSLGDPEFLTGSIDKFADSVTLQESLE
jgi:hypothetical protein